MFDFIRNICHRMKNNNIIKKINKIEFRNIDQFVHRELLTTKIDEKVNKVILIVPYNYFLTEAQIESCKKYFSEVIKSHNIDVELEFVREDIILKERIKRKKNMQKIISYCDSVTSMSVHKNVFHVGYYFKITDNHLAKIKEYINNICGDFIKNNKIVVKFKAEQLAIPY
uniref:Uncharacterized protein n=1 Tax=viral metagenome TaxID=1070528 RepID=A0A6C0EAW1_9ZZZZ